MFLLGEEQSLYIDAGFDLFTPLSVVIQNKTFGKSSHGIKCAMTYNKKPQHFIYILVQAPVQKLLFVYLILLELLILDIEEIS